MRIRKKPPPVITWKNKIDGEVVSQEVPISRKPGTKDEVVFELDGVSVTARIRKVDY